MTDFACIFAGCPERAVDEPIHASVLVSGHHVEVELRLCESHRDYLLRGTLDGLSLPPPATPAEPPAPREVTPSDFRALILAAFDLTEDDMAEFEATPGHRSYLAARDLERRFVEHLAETAAIFVERAATSRSLDVLGPFSKIDGSFTRDHGELRSLDDTPTHGFARHEIVGVLYQGATDDFPGGGDGYCAAVVYLRDGRLAAWEASWDVTGDSFHEDAYGGDGEVWFARPESLRTLVLQALTDRGRELCGIPREGLP